MPKTKTEIVNEADEAATVAESPKMELREREIEPGDDLNLAREPELEDAIASDRKPIKNKLCGLGLIVAGVALFFR